MIFTSNILSLPHIKIFLPIKSAIDRIAGLLFTVDEACFEKDWQVVQALRLLNDMQTHTIQIAFGGGTSLGKSFEVLLHYDYHGGGGV